MEDSGGGGGSRKHRAGGGGGGGGAAAAAFTGSAGTMVFQGPAGSSSTSMAAEVGNVELFGFPGLVFEVLKNGAVSALTVY